VHDRLGILEVILSLSRRVPILDPIAYYFHMNEKWEYQIVQNMALTGGNKKLIPELNNLGQEGWEAVSVSSKAAGSIEHVLLKRRLSQ
jgi:hypothetical protein